MNIRRIKELTRTLESIRNSKRPFRSAMRIECEIDAMSGLHLEDRQALAADLNTVVEVVMNRWEETLRARLREEIDREEVPGPVGKGQTALSPEVL